MGFFDLFRRKKQETVIGKEAYRGVHIVPDTSEWPEGLHVYNKDDPSKQEFIKFCIALSHHGSEGVFKDND